MTEVKIISDPYKHTITFETRDECDMKWIPLTFDIDPNSELLKDRISGAYFLEEIERICRAIWDEYGLSGHTLNVYFEGLPEEYEALKDLVGQSEKLRYVELQPMERQIENAKKRFAIVLQYYQALLKDEVACVGKDGLLHILDTCSNCAEADEKEEQDREGSLNRIYENPAYSEADGIIERFNTEMDMALGKVQAEKKIAEDLHEKLLRYRDDEENRFETYHDLYRVELLDLAKALRRTNEEEYSKFIKQYRNADFEPYNPESLSRSFGLAQQIAIAEVNLSDIESDEESIFFSRETIAEDVVNVQGDNHSAQVKKNNSNDWRSGLNQVTSELFKTTGLSKLGEQLAGGGKKGKNESASQKQFEDHPHEEFAEGKRDGDLQDAEFSRRQRINAKTRERFAKEINNAIPQLVRNKLGELKMLSADFNEQLGNECIQNFVIKIEQFKKYDVEHREKLKERLYAYKCLTLIKCETEIEEDIEFSPIDFNWKNSCMKNNSSFIDQAVSNVNFNAKKILGYHLDSLKEKHQRSFETWFEGLLEHLERSMNDLTLNMEELQKQIDQTEVVIVRLSNAEGRIIEARNAVNVETGWKDIV